jgi:indolepyruvate ferredoxin oxidoreductase beta subunit
MNVVLFGAMAKVLGLDAINWEKIISDVVPAKLRDLNLQAYRAGRDAVQI